MSWNQAGDNVKWSHRKNLLQSCVGIATRRHISGAQQANTAGKQRTTSPAACLEMVNMEVGQKLLGQDE